MQNSTISRDELMSSFQALQKQFDQQRSDIRDKEERFNKSRKKFATNWQKHRDTLSRPLGSDNPLQSLNDELNQTLNNLFNTWEKQITARAKGTRFREGLSDSLLVFIYGKVKSGKSSLGNYMAWGHSEPDATLKAQAPQPTYFSTERTQATNGDQDKEAEKNLQFRVGATEATSSIQGFRLPGLTWVDSPGLHSANTSNGDLAKEYVEHADLILYTMSSQAPGRASDMQEIAELLAAGKKIMVLLTGSDTTDEDEDESGEIITTIVMKAPLDRQAQIAYVQGELKQLCNSDNILAEVLSISTRYAERNSTPEGMDASGMGRLLQELQSICQSSALKIKLNTPMENLRRSIRSTADDLAEVRQIVDQFSTQVEQQDKKLEQTLAELGTKGANEMREHIRKAFTTDSAHSIEDILRKKTSELVTKLTLEALERIGNYQRQSLHQAFDNSRLSKLPEYKEFTEERERLVGINKGNKGLFGIAGSMLGGIAGFALGGLAGAALGASLGSSSSFLGRSANAKYESYQIVVGDNHEDRRQAAVDLYAKKFPVLLTEHVNLLYTPLRTSQSDYCKGLVSHMIQLKIELEQLAKVN